MEWYEILLRILGVLFSVGVFVVLLSLICFLKVFYSRKRKPLGENEFQFPDGEEYESYHEEFLAWMKDIRSRPQEAVSITSFDGLTLRGIYYEYSPDSPIELLFHGYRGTAERDLSGGVERCFSLGRSALLIDQRGAGKSDGHVISFGVNEHKDCLKWIEFATQKFGKDRKLIIGGISMGGATVALASKETLPENVVYAMADCSYSSAKEMIKKVTREMHLPADMVYPFIRLGAKIFGKFDIEDASPIQAVQRSTIPVIFIHGDADQYIPHQMSVDMHEVCNSEKKMMVTIEGAGHGLAFPKNKEKYLDSLRQFQDLCGF